MISTKDIPHSLEAEQSVIGGLLIDNQAWYKINDILNHEDFYHPSHKIIFSVLEELSSKSKPFDFLTLIETLKSSGNIDKIGKETYVYEIIYQTPSSANIKHYAEIVREKSLLRKYINIGNKIIESGYSTSGISASELIEKTEGEIFKLSSLKNDRNNSSLHINEVIPKTIEHIEKVRKLGRTVTGLETGFNDLDRLTSGLQPGELIIVAGRPSMGKTMLAMNIAENVAMQEDKKVVLIFSMEMPAQSLSMRMMSSLGKIDHQNLKSGRLTETEWLSLNFVIGKISQTNIIIDETSALSPSELKSISHRVFRKYEKIDLIIVDYLQLMKVQNHKGNKVEEVSEITRALKSLAKELNVPVIALSQLNRSLESRSDRRPISSDLRDSGSIEQDADLIAFIYRDEVYHPESLDKGFAEIIIAKQRNGPIDKIKLTFFGQYVKFENYSSARTWGN